MNCKLYLKKDGKVWVWLIRDKDFRREVDLMESKWYRFMYAMNYFTKWWEKVKKGLEK